MLRYPPWQWTATGPDGVEFRRRNLEVIQRKPFRTFDMTCLPFAFAANVKHLQAITSLPVRQLLHRDLLHAGQRKPGLLPRGNATLQKSARIFNSDARQAKPGFSILLRRIRNQHWPGA